MPNFKDCDKEPFFLKINIFKLVEEKIVFLNPQQVKIQTVIIFFIALKQSM